VGKALAAVRDKVYISSKIMLSLVNKPEDYYEILNRALEQMGLEYLDFYHFPALSYKTFTEKILALKLIEQAESAKAKGLIRNISFSFHSDPDKIPEIIDTGAFSTMLAQYNLVDRRNEALFAYAKEKGLGTMVMGPLMGGVFSDGGQTFLDRLESKLSSPAELGMRFCWSLPGVDMVLSGISSLQQLEENVLYAQRANTITIEERQLLLDKSQSLKDLNDLYCTACNYCNVCPHEIRIGRVFQLYLQHNIWGLSDAVRRRRGADGSFGLKTTPNLCDACHACSKRCPQEIDIATELKRVWAVLQGL
jgi:hypothetical protein